MREMFTRHPLRRNWSVEAGAGLSTPPVNEWQPGDLLRAGVQPLSLPVGCGPGFGYAMDPSDPGTWRRPVRFT